MKELTNTERKRLKKTKKEKSHIHHPLFQSLMRRNS